MDKTKNKPPAEKAELWKKFVSSGRIDDYLAYSRYNGDNAGTD